MALSKKAFLALIIILLPIIVVFLITHQTNKEELKRLILNNLSIVAEAYEGQVYQFLELCKRRALDFSSDGFIKDQLQKIIEGDDSAVKILNEHLAMNKLPLDKTIQAIYIISPDGKVVASTVRPAIGADTSDKPFFIKGKDNVAVTEALRFPGLAISAPIFHRITGKLIGVIANSVSFTELNKVLKGELNRELGAISWGRGKLKTMEAYIVNKDKLMITESLFKKDVVMKQIVDTLPVREALRLHREVSAFYKDYRGVEVAGASMYFPSMKWTLLIEVDKDEVMAPVLKVQRSVIITIVIVAGLISVLFVFYSKNILRPLRSLYYATGSVAKGDYNFTINVQSKDEIGILSESFNRMAQDINTRTTEIKQAKENYESLVNSIDGIVWEANAETFKFSFVSKQAERLLGYPIKDWITNPTFCKDHIHPDDSEQVNVLCMKGIAERKTHDIEFRIFAADGRIVWLRNIVNVVVKDEQVVKLRGVMVDITERKQAEEALKESEEKFRKLATSAQDAIVMMDNDGNISFWNDTAEKVFGYKREEVIGKPSYTFLTRPENRSAHERGFSRFRETGNGPFVGKTQELTSVRKNGTEFHMEASISPLMIKGRWNALGIFRDISERKKLEAQLRQSQKMEAVGQLAGGVAHDFNNMLTAIIGYGELLQMKMDKDNPLKTYLEEMLTAAERATNLTQSLLVFSRKQIMKPKPVNPNEIVKRIGKLLLRIIGENIELKTMLTDRDLIVMADAGQIEQVLMNLATNARDAMPKGGLLTIETTCFELDDEFIRRYGYGELGKYALIRVSDTGEGMNEETAKKIFEPFFTTKEVGKGTGLGLSIVYGIVKQHNGYINLSSKLEEGTTFHIYLPLFNQFSATGIEHSETAQQQLPAGGQETVLVAEDDTAVRALSKNILEQSGYKVIEAVNGEDAVNKFMENKNKIELLLFDVIMPKKNGKEAYEEIKKIKPDIKALFISGYAENIIPKKGILEEELNFISKPILPTTLLRKIKEILDKAV